MPTLESRLLCLAHLLLLLESIMEETQTQDPQVHANPRYESELHDLRSDLDRMGKMVGSQIAEATEALVKRDTARAHATIARDTEVNQLDIQVDDRCIRMLALYQPEAGDLRLITTGLKITTDLERIGDNAVNICQCVIEINRAPQARTYDDIPRIAAIAGEMVKDSVEAFVRGDAALAEAIIARDDEVDHLYEKIHHEVLSDMATSRESVSHGIRMLLVARYLERIADHATNVAEMVIFMVKGKTIRHMDMKAARQQLSRQTQSSGLA